MYRGWLVAGLLWGLLGLAPATAQAQPVSDTPPPGMAIATFATGCFWCTEADFDKVKGVVSTTSGYLNGKVKNPSYRQVSAGGTGHVEAVRVVFDPSVVTYERLLHVFWRTHDPLTANAQFCDRGDQYRPAVLTHSDEQRHAAAASKAALEQSAVLKGKIVTAIEPAGTFYAAEDYHQDYHLKNPVKYRYYRFGCGRDARLRAIWGSEAGGS
jgi:peptide-methionine (S)-S-oxide reductase